MLVRMIRVAIWHFFSDAVSQASEQFLQRNLLVVFHFILCPQDLQGIYLKSSFDSIISYYFFMRSLRKYLRQEG